MTLVRFFFCFAVMVSPLISQAACLKENQTVEVEGTLISKVVKLDPNDFGWVPADGLVRYTALKVDPAFCLETQEEGTLEGLRFIQVGYGEPEFTEEELKRGIPVTVKGSVYLAHTAHHFETALISPAIVTIKRK